jgi:hypothetical protein
VITETVTSSFVHVAASNSERTIKPISDGSPAQLTASCHCGKVQAELLVPITDLEIKEDNCSSCVRVRGPRGKAM